MAGTEHGGQMEERIVVADPVADPQGYQRELLALLGGQDPVAVLAATLLTPASPMVVRAGSRP